MTSRGRIEHVTFPFALIGALCSRPYYFVHDTYAFVKQQPTKIKKNPNLTPPGGSGIQNFLKV